MLIPRKLMLGLLSILIQGTSYAESTRKTLVVALDENEFLPYYQARADGSVSGFARELLDLFASDEGYRLDYQVYPLNRLQQLQLQSRVDLRFPDSPLWADKKKKSAEIYYSRPVVDYIDAIYCLPKCTMPDNGASFSILRGFTPLSFSGLTKHKVRFVETADLKAALTMHHSQRVNGVYGNAAVLMKMSRDGYGEKLTIQTQYPVTRDSYRLSSRQHKAVIEKFDRWYEGKRKEIDALLSQYQLSDFRP